LSLYSNLSNREWIFGYYRDNEFYTDLETIVDITGVAVSSIKVFGKK